MSDILSNFNLYTNINTPYSSNSNSTIPIEDPGETVVYFEQQFSNILDSLLFNVSSSDDSSDDLFSSSDTDSLDSITSFYPDQIALLQEEHNVASGNIDDLNNYAALIGKEARYIFNGEISQGLIQSVIIEDGTYFLKIDDHHVKISDVSEVTAT